MCKFFILAHQLEGRANRLFLPGDPEAALGRSNVAPEPDSSSLDAIFCDISVRGGVRRDRLAGTSTHARTLAGEVKLPLMQEEGPGGSLYQEGCLFGRTAGRSLDRPGRLTGSEVAATHSGCRMCSIFCCLTAPLR